MIKKEDSFLYKIWLWVNSMSVSCLLHHLLTSCCPTTVYLLSEALGKPAYEQGWKSRNSSGVFMSHSQNANRKFSKRVENNIDEIKWKRAWVKVEAEWDIKGCFQLKRGRVGAAFLYDFIGQGCFSTGISVLNTTFVPLWAGEQRWSLCCHVFYRKPGSSLEFARGVHGLTFTLPLWKEFVRRQPLKKKKKKKRKQWGQFCRRRQKKSEFNHRTFIVWSRKCGITVTCS